MSSSSSSSAPAPPITAENDVAFSNLEEGNASSGTDGDQAQQPMAHKNLLRGLLLLAIAIGVGVGVALAVGGGSDGDEVSPTPTPAPTNPVAIPPVEQPKENCDFECPANSSSKPGLACVQSIDQCECDEGYTLGAEGLCLKVETTPVEPPTAPTSTCKNDYVCPAFSYRIKNRKCYDTFADCTCVPGYGKNTAHSCARIGSGGVPQPPVIHPCHSKGGCGGPTTIIEHGAPRS